MEHLHNPMHTPSACAHFPFTEALFLGFQALESCQTTHTLFTALGKVVLPL